MWRIVWSDYALDRLGDIIAYVQADNPRAAVRLATAIVKAAAGLETMPHRGRPIALGRRELLVSGPYLPKYIVVGDEVRILAVRHSAQRPER